MRPDALHEAELRWQEIDALSPQRDSVSGSILVDLELGAGVGMHALQASRRQPERPFIAVEHSKDRFQRFWRRYCNHGSPRNLVPVHAHAESWVSHFASRIKINHLYLLYPNPYPKLQHRRKRWYGNPFFRFLCDCMLPGGKITLATNENFYAQEAKEILTNEMGWRLDKFQKIAIANSNIPTADEGQFHLVHSARTHFEKKFLESGQECFHLEFTNTSNDSSTDHSARAKDDGFERPSGHAIIEAAPPME